MQTNMARRSVGRSQGDTSMDYGEIYRSSKNLLGFSNRCVGRKGAFAMIRGLARKQNYELNNEAKESVLG